jgi:hypothetical protein
MFIAASFTVSKLWKQSRCSNTEFYSVTKRNEILLFAGKWIELENIILSEVSQIQKAKSHMFSFI